MNPPSRYQRVCHRGMSLASAFAIASLMAGCGGAAGGDDSTGYVARLVIVGPTTDTIQALKGPETFEVRVTNDGKPAPGAPVTLRLVVRAVNSLASVAGACGSIEVDGPKEATVHADADGRSRFCIDMGQRSDTLTLFVNAFSDDATDSANFVVLPGRATGVRFLSPDTAVFAGSELALNAAQVDRWDNPRVQDPVTYRSLHGAVSIAAATARGEDVGVARIVAEGIAGSDTTSISVVPRGTIASCRATEAGYTIDIVSLNLDGSGLQSLFVPAHQIACVDPVWSPDGQSLVFSMTRVVALTELPFPLHRMAAAGGIPVVLGASSGFRNEYSPEMNAAAGDWVYYALPRAADGTTNLRRMRLDGTGDESQGPVNAPGGVAWRPSLAPGARRLTYVTNNNGTTEATVRVFDLQNATISSWGVLGQWPAWRPGAEEIAYLEQLQGVPGGRQTRLHLIGSNGTGDRVVTDPAVRLSEDRITWSPDGVYLLVREYTTGLLSVVRVADGLIIPLPYSRYMTSAAWKP